MATAFQNKQYKVIQQLAQQQFEKNNNILVATLVTEPRLKNILGPDALAPLEEGDDLATNPEAVLAWFADVRLSRQAGGSLIKDCIVATQARNNIGQEGSPVTVWRDTTSGRYEIIGRADRVTEFQSVKSFTTQELGVGFVRGHTLDGSDVVSPFHQYTEDDGSILTASKDGHVQAGLNRGVAGWDSGGTPVTSYNSGVTIEAVPFGSISFGVDPFGVLYEVTHLATGGTSRVKRNP